MSPVRFIPLAMALALGALADNAPAPVPVGADKTPGPAITNAPTGASGISAAARDGASGENLVPVKAEPAQDLVLRRHCQLEIEAARQLRRQNSLAAAVVQLTRLLEKPVPEEFQQAALLELAGVARDENQVARAQQIYSQYLQRFPKDARVPDLLLQQGMIYREMGLNNLALAKFFAVLSSTLSLKQDRLPDYQRLVLQAQTEIADTYFLEGKFESSVDYLGRLLKLDNPALNRALIQFKLIRSLAALKRHAEVAAQSREFLKQHAGDATEGEVRFLLADALKLLGRNQEALEEVQALLKSQVAEAGRDPAAWRYWQQRTGNAIANQFYKDGEYLSALKIYDHLESLNNSPQWRVPVLYQIGLVYEHLVQPEKAAGAYRRLLDCEKAAPRPLPSGLKLIFEMAQWRLDFLIWHEQTEHSLLRLRSAGRPDLGTNAPPPPGASS